LQRLDDALEATPGDWLLGGQHPSHVDVQFIATIERLVASALYWKGLHLRESSLAPARFVNLERWLAAFEARPAYLATKGDYYSLVMAMPSQNGPGYSSPAAKAMASRIFGWDGEWAPRGGSESPSTPLEPMAPLHSAGGRMAARHEAAHRVITNHQSIVRFASRGASEPGMPSFHAELSDPFAEPREDFKAPLDICLRHLVAALLDDSDIFANEAARSDVHGVAAGAPLVDNWSEYEDEDGRPYYWNELTGEVSYTAPTRHLDHCLAYLRDRVGVPRDLSPAAALELRRELNALIELVRDDDGHEVKTKLGHMQAY